MLNKKMMKSIVSNILMFLVIYLLVNWWQNRNHLQEFPQDIQTLTLKNLQNEDTNIFVNNGKATILYFFAPWCTVCSLNTDAINSLFARDKFNIIAIGFDWGSVEELIEYQKKQNLSPSILLGTEVIRELFAVSAYPTFYYFNPSGQIIRSSSGYTSQFGLYIRTY